MYYINLLFSKENYTKITKKDIKSFTNKTVITYTIFNGAKLTPMIHSHVKNIKISKINYPNIYLSFL